MEPMPLEPGRDAKELANHAAQVLRGRAIVHGLEIVDDKLVLVIQPLVPIDNIKLELKF